MQERLRLDEQTFVDLAVREGVDEPRAERLWAAALEAGASRSGRFDLAHVVMYVGGLVALTAMSVFLGQGWSSLGPWFGFALSVAYLAAFVALAEVAHRRGEVAAAGLLATVATALVALVVYAFQQATGTWHDPTSHLAEQYYTRVSASWVATEVATVVAGLLLVRRYRFGLVLLPVGVAIGFAAVDVNRLLFGWDASELESALTTTAFGLAGIGLGRLLDRRGDRDLAFWPHLFGLLCVVAAIDMLTTPLRVWATLLGGAVSLGVIALGLRWDRTTYLVVGGLGLFTFLGDLSYRVFGDSLLFPVALAAIGVAVVAAGVRLRRWRPGPRPRVDRPPSAPVPAGTYPRWHWPTWDEWLHD